MEDMKAVYKLNEEKLNFNHRVLQEKIRVNEKTLKEQKEKERKYKDIKRQVIKRFNQQQKQEEKNLQEQYQYLIEDQNIFKHTINQVMNWRHDELIFFLQSEPKKTKQMLL